LLNGRLIIHRTAARFPLLTGEEFDALVADIKERGLQHPIALTADGLTVVDGINRLRACKEAKVEPRFHKLSKKYTELDIIKYIIGANLRRRDLNPGQRAMILLDLAPDFEEAAKQRQRAAGGDKKSAAKRSPSKEGNRSDRSGRVDHQLAAAAGVGHASISRARKVGEVSPALVAEVIAGTISLGDAYRQAKQAEKAESKQTPKETPSKAHVVLVTHTGQQIPYALPKGTPKFNRTNDQVSWAAWTWNPTTGCLHGCRYCYANELANRAKYKSTYPVGFTPHAPLNMQVPEGVPINSPERRVFVCSMADLFGKWVPDEWIEQVLAACDKNLQWEYLFLTKFPRRYVGLQLPPTAWVGTSVDEQKRVRLAEEAFRKIKDVRVKWLSLEPLLAPLEFTDLSMFNWIVIGSQSATIQPDGKDERGKPRFKRIPEFAPPFEWVARLTQQAHEAGCRVWQKHNLIGVTDDQHAGMQLVQEWPAVLDPAPTRQCRRAQCCSLVSNVPPSAGPAAPGKPCQTEVCPWPRPKSVYHFCRGLCLLAVSRVTWAAH
jgi:protein gp37